MRLLARLRFLFVPLGLLALVAVGAHAAADVLGERILSGVDRLEALLDSFFGAFTLTSPLVNLIPVEARTLLARGIALLWELFADALLALPMLGWEEKPDEAGQAKLLLRRVARRPTPLKLLRPLFTAALSVAGACSVARLVRGSLLSLGLLSRICAPVAVVAVLCLLATRAALRSLERAELQEARKPRSTARTLTLGTAGTLLLLPLALAALLGASPLWSFFR